MGFTVGVVALQTTSGRWGTHYWRYPRGLGPRNQEWLTELLGLSGRLSFSGLDLGMTEAVVGACGGILHESRFYVFTRTMVFSIFVSFLLPLWSLSFATEALGGEREGRNLVWLLTRPLSRPAIYLAKFVALLPWSLGLNMLGFTLLCLAGGEPGRKALAVFWPSVLCGALAFSSLFLLIGAYFRRPAVVALLYSFFLETILGNMPGYLKRVSISFYTRCMMFEVADQYGVPPEKPSVYMPVDGTTAFLVLLGVTAALLVLGMVVFTRAEYVSVD